MNQFSKEELQLFRTNGYQILDVVIRNMSGNPERILDPLTGELLECRSHTGIVPLYVRRACHEDPQSVVTACAFFHKGDEYVYMVAPRRVPSIVRVHRDAGYKAEHRVDSITVWKRHSNEREWHLYVEWSHPSEVMSDMLRRMREKL